MPGSGGPRDDRRNGSARLIPRSSGPVVRAILYLLAILLVAATPTFPFGSSLAQAQAAPARPAAARFDPGRVPAGARTIRDDSLEVIFWPGDEAMAERTLRAASRPLRLPGIPARAAPPSARILLAPTPAAFDSLTRGAPHWSAGIAVPAERVIVLPAYGSERTPTGDPLAALRHELVHLALNGFLGRRVPRWFDEGYATWASGEWDEGSGWRIRLALAGGGAPPLDSLRLGWPGAEADARLAYLLSASAVRFLAARAGEDAFSAFLVEWRRAGGFDPALRRVYGMTPMQFEEEWRGMVKRRYGWLLAVSQVGIFWGVVAVLLVVLTIPRRRRNREKLRRLRDEDWRDDAVAQAPEWAEELAEEGEGWVDPEARRG